MGKDEGVGPPPVDQRTDGAEGKDSRQATAADLLSELERVHRDSLAALQTAGLNANQIRHELSKLHVAVLRLAAVVGPEVSAKSASRGGEPGKTLELTKLRGSHLFEASRASQRAVVDFALAGLKGLLIANGGALIAMLTFIGSYRAFPVAAASLWGAFALFVIGLFTTLGAFVLAYLAQTEGNFQQESSAEKIHFHELGGHEAIALQEGDDETRHLKAAKIYRRFAIVCALGGAVAFAAGSGFGIYALMSGIPAA